MRFHRAAVLGAFVLAGATTLGAAPASAGSGRPFKGSATGLIVGSPEPGTLLIEATGNATHLGKFTRSETVTIGAGGAISGTLVFVAANGDELNVEFTGQFTSANDVAGTYTFTGGTGRFDDATGTARFTGSTPDFVHVSVSFEGTISY